MESPHGNPAGDISALKGSETGAKREHISGDGVDLATFGQRREPPLPRIAARDGPPCSGIGR